MFSFGHIWILLVACCCPLLYGHCAFVANRLIAITLYIVHSYRSHHLLQGSQGNQIIFELFMTGTMAPCKLVHKRGLSCRFNSWWWTVVVVCRPSVLKYNILSSCFLTKPLRTFSFKWNGRRINEQTSNAVGSWNHLCIRDI